MKRSSLIGVVAFLMSLGGAEGCGPDFPNWLLSMGDHAVLVAPEGDFAANLARIPLGPSRVQAVPPDTEHGYAEQSIDAEVNDLRQALAQNGISEEEAALICGEHKVQRQTLESYIQALRGWNRVHSDAYHKLWAADQDSQEPKPVLPSLRIVKGLPPEFADYFQAFIVWQNPNADKDAARGMWESLLGRPAARRHFKSTWAAFMLGRFWEIEAPEKAIDYFKQVRDLARRGFADTLGLAAASLGFEARIYLRQTNYEAAIEMYLQQMASGDPTATNSLATAAAKALESRPEVLWRLAANPRTQRVITAYVISRRSQRPAYWSEPAQQTQDTPEAPSPMQKWLRAAEQAGVKDMDSAEALALAAYQADDMEAAQRWIRRAEKSPVAQWLQAKLLLRSGSVAAAAALLARISPLFPILDNGTNLPGTLGLAGTLSASADEYSYDRASASRQVHGELGVLQLSRQDYVQALDSLLNAGFWMDAAYVADRVLTLDELKDYVDRFWPPASSESEDSSQAQESEGDSGFSPAVLRGKIRYLLARRLTRELRGDEAGQYYPLAWRNAFGQLAANLRKGWDDSAPNAERAEALFRAALITRTNGMELMGTEVAPDWHYHLGDFEEGVTDVERASNSLSLLVYASEDELRRYAQHAADPDKRFHYRYQAASLAWEAAKLLPDNNDRTAYVLWQGGTFLKYRDPDLADIFYKAMVRRNRKTVLGAEADRERWFPILDDQGNIVPGKSRSENEESIDIGPLQGPEQANESEPGADAQARASSGESAPGNYRYVIQKGDSLPRIVQGLAKMGIFLTTRDLLDANPGLEPTKLRVGQVVLIPAGGAP